MKPDLIFLHLPKNGGMTFHAILDRWYNREERFDIEVIDHTRLNTKEFTALSVAEKEKIKLLKGHMSFGLHAHFNRPFQYITLLRQPSERIQSFYHYVLRRPNHRLHALVAGKNLSLTDFVEQASDGDIHNAQVRWISGINDRPELMLEKAVENIDKHFSAVGFVEQFDKSMVLIQHKHGFPMPYYVRRNESGKKSAINHECEKLTTLIQDMNQADEALCKLMKRSFELQVKAIPRLQWKLNSLAAVNTLYDFYVRSLRPVYKKLF